MVARCEETLPGTEPQAQASRMATLTSTVGISTVVTYASEKDDILSESQELEEQQTGTLDCFYAQR